MTESTMLGEAGSEPSQAIARPASRSRPHKHRAIVEAAVQVFIEQGFEGASLDQIAQRAKVSKQTIYSHFPDKNGLFRAICTDLTEALTIPMRRTSLAGDDLRLILQRLGEEILTVMLAPASLALHRLVIAAAPRFPDLGLAAHLSGGRRLLDELTALFLQRSQTGDAFACPLEPEAARVLAEQFVGMIRGHHQSRALLGIDPTPPAERRAYVASCVELVLRAG